MAQNPDHSLPKAHDQWADLKAAYRFLANPRIQPQQITLPHRQQTAERAAQETVILCVQDGTDFAAVKVPGNTHVMHSTLAITPDGTLLGMLDQRWYERVNVPVGETPKQRTQRWRESDIWLESVKAIGPSPAHCRYLHVADRAADDLRLMHACVEQQCGFVVRSQTNRRLESSDAHLREHLQNQSICGMMTVQVGEQRNTLGRIVRRGRQANMAVRYATVRLAKPQNHPGSGDAMTVQAVSLCEVDPPSDVQGVQWFLLTSEAVDDFESAQQIINHYQRRWVIEEWHRALKEGCRLERSQLNDVASLKRLAAILCVVAVRLLQLRDLADAQRHGEAAQDPVVLQRTVPELWRVVVSTLAKVGVEQLTPRLFWETIARKGGWIGRKSDGRPGWKTIWLGWADLATMVQGAQLYKQSQKSCG